MNFKDFNISKNVYYHFLVLWIEPRSSVFQKSAFCTWPAISIFKLVAY